MSAGPVLLMTVLVAGPAFAEEPKSLEQLLRKMSRDAETSLKTNRSFPAEPVRLPAELAADSQTRQKLIKLLAKRLDSNPSIDGYLKWQLMNMGPDFIKADKRDLGRIAAAMPSLEPLPQLTGSQRKMLAASDKMNTETFQKRVMPHLDRYFKQVELVKKLNTPAWEYRDKVVSRMPVEGGLRMYANVLNAHEQYRALHFEMVKPGKGKKGNNVAKPANPVADAVFSSARMLEAAPKPPPAGLRRAMLARLTQIKGMHEAHVKAGHAIGYTVENTKVTATKPPNPFTGKNVSFQKIESFLKGGSLAKPKK